MRDFHLILFVLGLVIIDVIFITVWVYFDPLEMKEIVFDELVRINPGYHLNRWISCAVLRFGIMHACFHLRDKLTSQGFLTRHLL